MGTYVNGTVDAERIDAAEERAATYGLLARLFNREVDEAMLEGLRALPLFGGEDCEAPEGARLMGVYLAEAGEDALRELAVDFARLFIVRTAKTVDAPYPSESVYTSVERITMGDARDAVLTAYRREGLDKSGAWNLPEDHIALELEFMQVLCGCEAEALRVGDSAEAQRLEGVQHDFLAQHLAAWTPPFFDAMERGAQTSFYQGLAQLTTQFLQDEAAA